MIYSHWLSEIHNIKKQSPGIYSNESILRPFVGITFSNNPFDYMSSDQHVP